MPVSPSSRITSAPLAWPMPGEPAVHSSSLSYAHVDGFHVPGAHATGRCDWYAIGVCHAMHSSWPHGRNAAPLAVVIMPSPLTSGHSSGTASTFVTPPRRFAMPTSPERLTEVRDGLPAESGRTT